MLSVHVYSTLMQWNRISTYRGRMVRLNGVPVPDVTRTILPSNRLVSFRLSSSSRSMLSLTCMKQMYLMNNQGRHSIQYTLYVCACATFVVCIIIRRTTPQVPYHYKNVVLHLLFTRTASAAYDNTIIHMAILDPQFTFVSMSLL